jgi:hypothetical protein
MVHLLHVKHLLKPIFSRVCDKTMHNLLNRWLMLGKGHPTFLDMWNILISSYGIT